MQMVYFISFSEQKGVDIKLAHGKKEYAHEKDCSYLECDCGFSREKLS
jgi:hypothetical protein